MFVNIDGSVSAKILDTDGTVLAESSTFFGNSTKAELVFDEFDISSLCKKEFRIEFSVRGKLYSFGFTDGEGDFGGAHAAGVVC